jgi:pyridoxal phosphate enzyme (YggS family)
MVNVSENIRKILAEIPPEVKLIPISKTKPDEMILSAWGNGFKIFGENKVQDLVRKYENLPKDIEWHMVGHMQSNKVKYLAPFVYLIHGVDSFRLLKIMNKEALKTGRVLSGLFQIHIAKEETKFGFSEDEVRSILDSDAFWELKNINMIGLMGMATNTPDVQQVSYEFRKLKKLQEDLRSSYFSTDDVFNEVSMGMSGDYKIAVEEGSTMIRIGSLIFGPRN